MQQNLDWTYTHMPEQVHSTVCSSSSSYPYSTYILVLYTVHPSVVCNLLDKKWKPYRDRHACTVTVPVPSKPKAYLFNPTEAEENKDMRNMAENVSTLYQLWIEHSAQTARSQAAQLQRSGFPRLCKDGHHCEQTCSETVINKVFISVLLFMLLFYQTSPTYLLQVTAITNYRMVMIIT